MYVSNGKSIKRSLNTKVIHPTSLWKSCNETEGFNQVRGITRLPSQQLHLNLFIGPSLLPPSAPRTQSALVMQNKGLKIQHNLWDYTNISQAMGFHFSLKQASLDMIRSRISFQNQHKCQKVNFKGPLQVKGMGWRPMIPLYPIPKMEQTLLFTLNLTIDGCSTRIGSSGISNSQKKQAKYIPPKILNFFGKFFIKVFGKEIEKLRYLDAIEKKILSSISFSSSPITPYLFLPQQDCGFLIQ